MRSGLDQVLTRFLDKVLHGQTKELHWRRGNVFFEGDIMYSYGRHFPLVVRRSAESNLKDGTEWYLCNGDKYSPTTSQHQFETFQGRLKDSPRLAFSALNAIEIIPGDWGSSNHIQAKDERLELIDYSPDHYAEWSANPMRYNNESCKYEPTGETVQPFEEWRKSQPMGASISLSRDSETNEVTRAYSHRVGVVLFRFPKFKMVEPEIRNTDRDYIIEQRARYVTAKGQYRYFLCGMDEGSYFISELARPTKTVGDAFQSLKPGKVKEVERENVEVLRQGDWFFVPLNGSAPKIADRKFRQEALPKKAFQLTRRSNTHYVRLFKQGKDLYCKGTVYHRNDNGRRGDHRALKLPGTCLAFQNTSVRDWSANGRVD